MILTLLSVALPPVNGFGQASGTQTGSPSGLAVKPTGSASTAARQAANDKSSDSSDNTDNGSSIPASAPIVVNTPAPQPAPWTLHERVAWAATIVLAVLGYVGIMLGLRLFRNIQRQTDLNAATAQAALDAATAALAHAQAIVNSERPWIVITVEPFLTMENSFKIIATNRGRTPARVLSTVDRVKVAVNETQLPESPEYATVEGGASPDPMVLLPGETAGILAFSRDDVRAICKTDAELSRIELWQESIFLYGRLTYQDLITPADSKTHETSWCCRYIHGEKKSALVIAGPPLYNHHT
ncbi:MAG TPA: hypothetical protein VFI20_03480 [Terracidiphilus sp.]|nr:hypothetical protein [Terracidiphilus sp.]